MILVFGKTGQVARALSDFPDVVALGRQDADLTNPQACTDAIVHHAPRAVINAAAYTAVDRAEDQPDLADLVNAQAPAAIANVCQRLGIPLVHISTDYVFDGSGDAPRTPDAEPNPINEYGRSKLAGEAAIRKAGGVYAIVRTSWVFSGTGRNFVTTMLNLSKKHNALNVVDDQIGGPTAAADIATACHTIALALCQTPQKSGTYHLSGAPDVSWADFARAIFDAAGVATSVKGISTAEYPTRAKRPGNSRLDCAALETFALSRPDWRAALGGVIEEAKATS